MRIITIALLAAFLLSVVPASAHHAFAAEFDGNKKLTGRDVTLPEGKQLFAGSSGNGAPYDTK